MIKSESAGNSHHLGQLVAGQESRRSPSRHGHVREREARVNNKVAIYLAIHCLTLPITSLAGNAEADGKDECKQQGS